MPALVAGIHVFALPMLRSWMAVTKPGHDDEPACG
jgi:hypothetical protein